MKRSNLFNPLIIAAFLVLGLMACAFAETPKLCFPFEGTQICVPLANTSVVYLYDGINNQSLVGAETPVVIYKRYEFTVGAITTPTGAGSPTIGADVDLLGTAIQNLPLSDDFKIGGWGGRDFNQGRWMAGVKCSLLLW